MGNPATTITSESFAQIPKQLACYVGLNEAVILQELHKMTESEKGQVVQGVRWIRMTLEEWIEILPFFDRGQIERAVSNLINDGLVIAATFSGRSKWYAVIYEKVNALSGPVSRLADKKDKRVRSLHNVNAQNVQICQKNNVSAQNEHMHKMSNCNCSKCADVSAQNEQLPITFKEPSNNHPINNAHVREYLPGPIATAILECCDLDFAAVSVQDFLRKDFLAVTEFARIKNLECEHIRDIRRYWNAHDYRSANGARAPTFKQFLEIYVPWQNWVKADRPEPKPVENNGAKVNGHNKESNKRTQQGSGNDDPIFQLFAGKPT